ncbi:hypothetical protein LEP1GSC133_4096 [Leptospira borgpetersenii serovar Pomona str. 200901868]|uniref:Uncharacterized protein n=2 Tax=Leptospira borgpetersenii TaxID=174 RepID=A0A0S2IPS9_LEPBO|nr:hypothetical protein LBBP_01367 [Leptospira borgpetersenii serovar Ballum]EKQ93651.1 hypothetical protein LEP1GSC101_0386 [Leptospira borgpetersenii str. UI 09149]EMK14431.1 hypothetical protein LEP1GSC066_0604 [Leptospira sp. serovar Kenya str. Sh9]EMO10995.1 hypothetical protein LEP1GSC137_4588 [Leptospira borgpetersenii str. Noumea 25]EMO63072.1 hypothetical protein LEP1GSC133_4096 [Leptospira borgpetersenii serovar Pomona str. 200901868]
MNVTGNGITPIVSVKPKETKSLEPVTSARIKNVKKKAFRMMNNFWDLERGISGFFP